MSPAPLEEMQQGHPPPVAVPACLSGWSLPERADIGSFPWWGIIKLVLGVSPQTTRGQILQEYRKIKKVREAEWVLGGKPAHLAGAGWAMSHPRLGSLQTNTNYSREKRRCEYLHRKLAHIKRLIAEYDQRQLQAWP